MVVSLGKLMFPLIIILCIWLAFEVLEFFRLGGAREPLAWCIVKISVITSTIIGLSSDNNFQIQENADSLLEKIQTLYLDDRPNKK